MSIYKKIEDAKAEIKNTKLEKKGHNKFSNYKYFTPDQVEFLVSDACHKHGLTTLFDLVRTELGEAGQLHIIDTESSERHTCVMATAIPEIKATNIAQQLGGCVTYTERYLKMSAFGITDNSLDFDDNANSPAKPKKNAPANKEELTPEHNKWSAAKTAIESKKTTVADIKKKYNLSSVNEKLLTTKK